MATLIPAGLLCYDEFGNEDAGPKDNQRYDCNTRRSDGTLVFYEPGSGYTGADSISLYVIYPVGTAQTRHYAVEVK